MLINLSELFTGDGKEKTYTQELDMIKFTTPEGTYEVVKKEPVELHMQHLGDRKLLMSAKASLSLSIPCGRCLDPVIVPFSLEMEQELDMNQSEEERVEDLNEQPYVSGYNLDVDRLVGNELLLNMPMKVLCNENCKGICNRCGANLNRETCSCDRSSPDVRMSVIQDIFQRYKEV